MKVSGVGSGSSASGAKRVDKSDGKKGEFKKALVEAMDTMEEVHAVETASGIGAVDALLVVQSVGDTTERESRRRLISRGEDILDRLEEIRHGLLLGVVPKEKLVQLAQMVRNKRENCADPRLGALLDEIELRAEVEIAKLSRDA
ncbi:MAG TPA: flagellar assembly protein FliX [Candidatus Omnitrophota bacterium]|nr:flagellar assembly protein FliX [Candidatus Omnitrophota bacterium]